jgi:hypothetical protein
MTINLIEVIDAELEDRTIQANESGEPEEYKQELEGLSSLRLKVEEQRMLSFEEYEWLCDLTASHREAQIRDELE